MSVYCPALILSCSHHIHLCNVNWRLQSHPVIRCVITAQAVKTISVGSTWTQKDYSWYVLKPAAWLDINPISGQFCNCEHTLKSSSPALGRPAHAWCLERVELCWPGMTDGHWDTRDLCSSHFPPQTKYSDSNEPPIKQGGVEGGGEEGGTRQKMIGQSYSARQQAYHSPRGISHISHRQKLWTTARGEVYQFGVIWEFWPSKTIIWY